MNDIPVEIGQVLAGKYKVEDVLGVGGMGVVVAARHLQLDQVVALKFLLPEAIANPEALGRFEREARNAARLRSEHVARIIDVGTLEGGAPYIVMEFLQGSDLAGVLAQQRALPIPVAVDFILQTCDAIAEAHALGIIHRDLKPQNLFVTRRHDNTSLVKVLDFGISKSTAAGGDFAATSTQAVMGSPAYMSPEQMRSAKLVDARTDVWALGIILYELVVGHVPWKADTFTELCFKIAIDPPPPFPSAQQAGFEEVVWRCLEKDPDRRFSDVYALAVALSPFAPTHTQPLVEGIGRVLGSRASERDAIPTIVDRVLRSQAGERAAMSTLPNGLSTLREATGQSVRRTAAGSRQRRIAGVIAAIGVLAGIVVTMVALGRGRGGEATDKPTLLPLPDHAAAQPASAAAQVIAQPPPPPPPSTIPEPPTTHESTPAATLPAKLEPSLASSTATKPRDKERHHRPSITTPIKPSMAAPPTAARPPSTPPLTEPTATPDPLSSPD